MNPLLLQKYRSFLYIKFILLLWVLILNFGRLLDYQMLLQEPMIKILYAF